MRLFGELMVSVSLVQASQAVCLFRTVVPTGLWVSDRRICGSLLERGLLKPVAGLSIAGVARSLARRNCFVGDARPFRDLIRVVSCAECGTVLYLEYWVCS
jgi:hypothetical protein